MANREQAIPAHAVVQGLVGDSLTEQILVETHSPQA